MGLGLGLLVLILDDAVGGVGIRIQMMVPGIIGRSISLSPLLLLLSVLLLLFLSSRPSALHGSVIEHQCSFIESISSSCPSPSPDTVCVSESSKAVSRGAVPSGGLEQKTEVLFFSDILAVAEYIRSMS